jgi:hypothetical protein
MGERESIAGFIVRTLAASAAAAIAFGAAIVFEAAAKTELAVKQAHAAADMTDAQQRSATFDSAAALIETSWARPAAWHAGSLEALSWLRAQQGAFERAEDAASRSLRLDPVQPAAWARLAALAETGTHVRDCDTQECLERSWRAAKMTDPTTACARLELAYRAGLLAPRDERILWTAKSGFFLGRDTRECFAFLPRQERVRAILLAEADRALRAQRSRARR